MNKTREAGASARAGKLHQKGNIFPFDMDLERPQLSKTLSRWNDRVNGLLAYPGMTPQSLLRKKIYWIACIILLFGLSGMTALTTFLGLRILTTYGILLIAWYVPVVLIFCLVKRELRWLGFATSLFVILLNFLFMLKLGGILNSGGIVFASLSALLFTTVFQNLHWSVITFTGYAGSILVVWVAQPALIPAPEMTPVVNQLIFILNILWISAFTLAFVVYYIYQSIYYEKAKARQLQELNEAKNQFYTNITHEFRTPLTLMLGMVDLIEENPRQWLPEGTESIRRNSKNLLYMVNQMLDLSKLDSGALAVQLRQGDIVFYLKYLLESFHSLAAGKRITLQFKCQVEHFQMDYDAEKLLHVLSNLLVNAIKFTPEGGRITLSVAANEATKTLTICVQDNGVGISAEALPHIFDRFFSDGGEVATGTGLGLALAKDLVKLLGGTIAVQSSPGEGAAFTITLPVRNEAMLETTPADLLLLPGTLPVPGSPAVLHHKRLAHLPLLLIVEDNQEVIHYLISLLGKDYQIEFAFNGAAGLEKALALIPDIIVSDVMMPVMDGFALLESLKKDLRTSHIPVVLLTARADVASRLSGLERGADAYLAKPFHKTELLVELKKLIGLRKILQARYASTELPPPSSDQAIQQEDAFMQKVREILEIHLSDEDFGIPQLCRALAMSRAQLYRKFDALTDLPVQQYMRNLRLRKAKILLETTRLNVTEVAQEVGFKNLSHFSRSFSETFGRAPSDVRN